MKACSYETIARAGADAREPGAAGEPQGLQRQGDRRVPDGVRRDRRAGKGRPHGQALGLGDNLGELRAAITDWKPDIAFNLLEEFQGIVTYDQYVVAFLELMRRRTPAAIRAA